MTKDEAKQSLVERTMKLHDQIADLGDLPFTAESRRAYQAGLEQGFDAGYKSACGEQVSKGLILTLIKYHAQGDDAKFANYARFIADKTEDPFFIRAVTNFLDGEFGLEVIAFTEPADNEQTGGENGLS